MPDTDHWHPTACILNCGLEVQRGGDDGRQFVRIKGDKRHPESRGYLCQKAVRLNHYQNTLDRLLAPLRRRSDGSFEEVDWQTVIREVAERLTSIRDTHSGASIFYFGGGGQGNHLAGVYAGSTRRALGSIYKSNALAQEKTGEIWVNQQMFESGRVHGDFERCEVGIFLGKNPWQYHRVPRARVILRQMARDPRRALVVIDVARTETADLADYFLQAKPGTDAWLLLAMLGVLVDERLIDRDWIEAHTSGFDELLPTLTGGVGRRGLRTMWGAAGRGPSDRSPNRVRGQCLGGRGPWRSDEPALDARELSAAARVAADRAFRQAGGAQHSDQLATAGRWPDAGVESRPCGRCASHRRSHSVQPHPRGDPDRPPGPLPQAGR